MFIFYLLAIPILLFLFFEIKYYKYKRIINRIPGPSTLPILGNAHNMGRTPSEIISNFFLYWNQYGKKSFRFWVGYIANVVISDVKDIEFVLSSNTLIRKSDAYDMLHPWLGTGLLTSFGEKWFKHRKMITPAFHFKILQNFHDVMNKNSLKFVQKLKEASVGETIFDVQGMVQYFTLDVICDTAMGVHMNAMDNNDAILVKAFEEMCTNINLRAFHPINRKNFWYKFSPDYPHYKKTLKILQDFTYEVIAKRQKALQESNGNNHEINAEENECSPRQKQAFLDTLLSAKIDGRPLTLHEVYEEVSTFMFEGHDTTTSGVSFAIYLLSRHPTIQQKVFAEQQQIFVDKQLHRAATFNEVAEMKYLELVIKESQRLYPSVPIIGRHTDRDYNMNGTIIPKNTDLNLFIIGMGYNEKHFKDPYLCRPERFDIEERGLKRNPFEYIPFSGGLRNCIGQKFAMLELKTIISQIVRTFEILPPLDELISTDCSVQHFYGLTLEEQQKRKPTTNKYDPILSSVLTLKSENGIWIRLRPRK